MLKTKGEKMGGVCIHLNKSVKWIEKKATAGGRASVYLRTVLGFICEETVRAELQIINSENVGVRQLKWKVMKKL